MSKAKTKPAKTEKAPKVPKEHKEVKRPYSVIDCMRMGRIGNILFVIFIIICLIYYYSIGRKGNYAIPFEVVAYSVEMAGFAFFSASVILLDRLVRARKVMKILLLVYIVVEVFLMLLEFQFIFAESGYDGRWLWLTVTHSIFSAGVAFSLLSLDPANKHLEVLVFITCALMLASMFLGLAGYRVYASILVNAFAYIFFFTAMERQLRLEEVEVDCYGDKARVTTFDSTMFVNSPLLVEKPPKQKRSLKKKAKMLAEQLTSEEQTILTDTKEKFEYEFGVEDADDDEDEEE